MAVPGRHLSSHADEPDDGTSTGRMVWLVKAIGQVNERKQEQFQQESSSIVSELVQLFCRISAGPGSFVERIEAELRGGTISREEVEAMLERLARHLQAQQEITGVHVQLGSSHGVLQHDGAAEHWPCC